METDVKYVIPMIFHTDNSAYVYDDATRLVFPISSLDEKILETKLISSIDSCDSPRLYNLIKRYNLFVRQTPPPTIIQPADIISMTCKGIEGGLVLHVSDACNLRCKYCFFSDEYQHTVNFSKTLMSREIAKSAVDFYINSCMEANCCNPNINYAIAFYGGEPLINWDVIQYIVEYIKGQYPLVASRIMYAITTNGVLLDDNKIQYMLNNHFAISISMDGNETEHDRNRVDINRQPTHMQVVKAVTRTDQLYREISKVNSTVLKPGILITYDNITDLVELNSYFTANPNLDQMVLKVSKVFDQATTYYDNQRSDAIKSAYGKRVDYLFDLFEKQKGALGSSRFLHRFISTFFVSMATSKTFGGNPFRGTCLPGQGRIAIDPYGKIHVCEKISRNYSIGNINTGFDRDMQSSMVNEFIQTCHNYCESCSIINLCTLCYATTQSETPLNFDLPTREKCELMKNNALWLLSKQYKLLEKNISVF